MKLRSHLLVVAAATLVPMTLFAVGGAWRLAERERAAYQNGATERVRAVMSAVDAELRGAITTLEALASLPVFDGGGIEAFHGEARRVQATQPGWIAIVVNAPGGEQVLNTLVPPGAPLPPAAQPASALRAVESGRPVVGDATRARLAQDRPVFTVRVPVLREGRAKYVLTAAIDVDVMARLLEQQRFPDGWLAAVIDGSYQFVVRNPSAPGASTHASPSLRRALQAAPEGWDAGRTLEGADIYRAYTRSSFSGWSVSMAIPKSAVDAAATQAAWILGFGGLLAVAAGVALAFIFARRVTVPIASMAAAVPRLGESSDAAGGAALRTNVDELQELVDALREAGRTIQEREAALLANDRAKDEFLAMLGHELRNPLATLATSAELLRIGRDQPGIVENAQSLIARQTQHMVHLVDDLLEVSRVTGGKIVLDRAPVELGALAARVVRTWRDAGRLARHEVTESLEPVWVDGDAARIEQIVSNLLDNAVKYTPAGGHIAVRVGGGEQAVLEVSDDGEGIAPELVGRVFELFVQGERGLARQPGGLGIGLTLVKRLAELHRGTVSAESAGPGRGSRFTVRFPSIEQPSADAGLRDAAAARPAKKRVIIIEDNADARDSLARLLRMAGHEVTVAENGMAGLRAAIAGEHDIALVDIGLPDIDGYEVAQRLRASPEGRRLSLIAVTGYGKEEDRSRALAAGFDRHMTKPVAMEALEEAIDSVGSPLRRSA